jgi:hypothetical protein
MKQGLTASLIVTVHTLILLIHGNAHLHLHIGTQRWQSVFIAVVIFLGPVVATALLWTRLEKAGAALMAVTMAGAFVFGAINHFVLPGSDNVLEMQLGQWAESLFVVSAIGLGLIEAGGMAWGFMALKHMRALSR